MGPFFWGEGPPAVAPEGDLVLGESQVALDIIQSKFYICTTDWGVRYAQKTWKSFLRLEATWLLDIPSVGEFLTFLVRQLVCARLEHLDDNVGPLLRW
jgi:hypothetical protein